MGTFHLSIRQYIQVTQRFFGSLILLLVCTFIPSNSNASGSIALTPNEETVCCVNQDSGSVSLWDWKTDQQAVEISVGQEPRSVVTSPDGKFAYVTTQRSQELAVIDLSQRKCTDRIALGGQPVGIVLSRDGQFAYISKFAGDYLEGKYSPGVITQVDLSKKRIVKQISVKARSFAMTCSPDGKHLYVTHYFHLDNIGWVTEINLQKLEISREFSFQEDKEISTGKGGVFNALAGITVHPKGHRLLVAGMHANVHRGLKQSGQPLSHKTTVQAVVRIVDLDSGSEMESSRIVSSFSGQAVAVPSAVSFLPDGQHFIDIYFASNDMKVLSYNESGYVAERSLTSLPAGPTGIVTTQDGKNAFFNCRWARSVAQLSIENIRQPKLIRNQKVSQEPWNSERLLGAKVFHNTRDPRMTPNRWLSCGTCHLDGGILSDNLFWEFTKNQKPSSPEIVNTKSLAVTAWSGPPYLIKGTYQSIHEEDKFIRQFLGGSGFLNSKLSEKESFPENPTGQSEELDAMCRYVLSLRPRPNPHKTGEKPRPEIADSAQRGRSLFYSREVGCFRCHRGSYLTRSGSEDHSRLYDVGTGIQADVPSLMNLWETEPYLHDGRAKTLQDVITRFNPEDRHGKTSQLNVQEKEDLVHFLLAPF